MQSIRLHQGGGGFRQPREYRAMCTFDRGVSGAKPRADVEGGCAAAADDDVVCVGVVFAPIDVVAGGAHTPSSLYVFSRLAQDGLSAGDLILYVFVGWTRHQFVSYIVLHNAYS
jgi:hypothetical protein